MNLGQIASQAGHAFKTPLYQCARQNPELADSYMGESYGSNITMQTRSLHHLLRAYDEARAAGLFCCLTSENMYPIPGTDTITGLGIGPARRSQTDRILKRFQLMKESDCG